MPDLGKCPPSVQITNQEENEFVNMAHLNELQPLSDSAAPSPVFSDDEILATLEREREMMRSTVNYLEAFCARLARSTSDGRFLSVVTDGPTTNSKPMP